VRRPDDSVKIELARRRWFGSGHRIMAAM
jgi:hypothetical protein